MKKTRVFAHALGATVTFETEKGAIFWLLVALLLVAGWVVVLAFFCMFCWNMLIAGVLHGPPANFWIVLAALLLISPLFNVKARINPVEEEESEEGEEEK